MAKKMKVTVFVEPGRIALDEKPISLVGSLLIAFPGPAMR